MPCIQHRIRPICDVDVAMVTKIRPGAQCFKGADSERPLTQPLVLVRRHSHTRLGPCSRKDCNTAPPLCVFVSCRPSDFLFHDPQHSCHGCFSRSRTLRSCLFDSDRPFLYRPILPLPYSTIGRVVVTPGATRLHILVLQYAVHELAIITHYSGHFYSETSM